MDLRDALREFDKALPVDRQPAYAEHALNLLTSIKAMGGLIDGPPETVAAALTGTIIGACLQNLTDHGMTKDQIMKMVSEMVDVIVFEVKVDEIRGTSKPN